MQGLSNINWSGVLSTVSSDILPAAAGAYSYIRQGQAEAGQFAYEAGTAGINANLVDVKLRHSEMVTELQKKEQGRQFARHVGTRTARKAAMGMETASGSGLEIAAAEAGQAAEEAWAIGYEGELERMGLEQEQAMFRREEDSYRSAAEMARTSGKIGAMQYIPQLMSGMSKWDWRIRKQKSSVYKDYWDTPTITTTNYA